MARTPTGRIVGLSFSLLLLLVAPLGAFAAHAAAGSSRNAATGNVVIEFGRQGGNIRPFSISMARDGAITGTGMAASTNVQIKPDAVNGLVQLAKAEHFFKLPSHIASPGVLPDVASLYIQVTTPTSSHKVQVHGGLPKRFAELFSVLEAVAGIPSL